MNQIVRKNTFTLKSLYCCVENGDAFTFFLFLFPLSCCLTAVIGFLNGIAISDKHFYLSVLCSLACSYLFCGEETKKFFFHSGLSVLLLLFLIALSSFFMDFFFDSVWYHYPAQTAIASGWNPIHTSNIGFWNNQWTYGNLGNTNSAHWINHFPKASWYIGGVVYAAFPKLESANFAHLLYILLSGVATNNYLRTKANITPFKRIGISATAALNPVAVVQWQTAYVDGMLGSLLTITFFSLLGYIESKKRSFLFYLLFSAPLLMNVKMSGFFYAVLFFLGFLLLILFGYRNVFRNFIVLSTAVFFLAVLIGWNPYGTNLFTKKIHSTRSFA